LTIPRPRCIKGDHVAFGGPERTFCVVIPTYNRARTLGRALASLREQTYERWVALVLDDGSTDTTPELMRSWQAIDRRFLYTRYPNNRGGVAMNEIGMRMACEMTEWWTRLGSDDYFGPTKLALDAEALADHDACYGPFQVSRADRIDEMDNPPMASETVRRRLLGGRFAASWANCAVRTSVLRAVHDRYGEFCDPRLRNMEDFLVNSRVARLSRGWVWRGRVAGTVVVDPPDAVRRTILRRAAPVSADAVWTSTGSGASGDARVMAADFRLTRALIARDSAREVAAARA
jgi:glycosyltransferase involved in cell wall biosynthesis